MSNPSLNYYQIKLTQSTILCDSISVSWLISVEISIGIFLIVTI
jgi:hypothetical protein